MVSMVGVVLGHRGLEADVVLVGDRVRVEDDLEALLALVEVVHAAEVEEELEVEVGVVAQQRAGLDPGRSVDGDARGRRASRRSS